MQVFTHINRRPAKALVLIAAVAALGASTALGASPHPRYDGVRPNDRPGPLGAAPGISVAQKRGIVASHTSRGGGFTTGAYGAPPAISTASPTSGSYAAPAPSANYGHVRPDDRAGIAGTHAQSAVERLRLQEQARGADLCGGLQSCGREVGRAAVAPSVTIVQPSAFQWGDAGVGAAGAFGLMLLASGVVIVSRRSYSHDRETPSTDSPARI